MTGNEYQKAAMRTANLECMSLSNVGLGLAGEAGKAADAIKKHLHHGHPLDKDKLAKELGDVMWYVALGCTILGYDLDDVLQMNVDKLKARYPDGFDTERSIHRSEYESEAADD